MSIFGQKQYKNIPIGTSEIADDSWCAICSIAYIVSNLTGLEYSPEMINGLLKTHNGFWKDRYVIWKRLETIFPDITVKPHIWDGTHNIEKITLPAIISVDAMKKEGYQSHFMVAEEMEYKKHKIKNIRCFDPYTDSMINVIPKYGKNIEDSVFSIINFSIK